MEPRSYMFLLPQREKVFDNLKHWSKPDCYIVDLQDGCPRSLLKTARANIIKYADDLRSLDTRILLRINGFNDPKEFNEDIKLLSLGFIDGVMLPYINDVKDLVCLDKALSNAELEYGQAEIPDHRGSCSQPEFECPFIPEKAE